MLSRLVILTLCLAALTAFNGCAKKVYLYPQTEKDIRQEGEWTCVTEKYMEEIMKVRLGK